MLLLKSIVFNSKNQLFLYLMIVYTRYVNKHLLLYSQYVLKQSTLKKGVFMIASQKILRTIFLLSTWQLLISNITNAMLDSENNIQAHNHTQRIKEHVVECLLCHSKAPHETPLENIRLLMTHTTLQEEIIRAAHDAVYCECIHPICRNCIPSLLLLSTTYGTEESLPNTIDNPTRSVHQYYPFFNLLDNAKLLSVGFKCLHNCNLRIRCLSFYAYCFDEKMYEIFPSISDAILDLINCHKSSPAPSNATLRIKNIVDRFMNGNINLLLKKQNGYIIPLSMSIFDLALERFEAAHNTCGFFKERSPEQKESLLYTMLHYMLNDLSMRSGRHSCQLQAFQEVFGFAQTHQLSQRIKNLLLQYSTIDAIFAYKNALKAMYSDDPQEQSALRYLYDYIKREIQQRLGKTTENKETQTNTQNSTATQTASRRTQPNAPDCIIC